MEFCIEKLGIIRESFKKHWLIYCVCLVMIILGERYVSLSARNVVFMDFWRNINRLITPVMNGEWPWADFWNTGSQRNFIQMFLLALNIKFTNLNCLWEVYAGIIVIGITGLLLYFSWEREVEQTELYNRNNGNLMRQIVFVPVIFCLFNLNQWEILSLQFSFAFMLRILGYVVAMMCLNNLFQEEETSKIKYVLLGLFYGVLVDLMSQLYWPALLIIVVITWVVDLLRKRHIKIFEFLAFWLPVLCSIYIYCWNLETNATNGSFEVFWNLIESGDFFIGVLYMLVGSLVPQSKIEQMSQQTIMILGVFLLCVILFAVVAYFYFKLWDRTYLPMMLCAYGLISIPIIIYGRAGSWGLFYLTASRYSVETTLIWSGVLFTFAYLIFDKKVKICGVATVILLLFITYADFTEFSMAPYRGAYKDELLVMLNDLDSYKDEDLAAFQANDAQMVRDGAELMKKYSLNIFGKNQ